MIGIYKITNLVNGKVYIGQSVDIKKRWEDHKFYSGKENTAIQAAFKKYGISNFSFEIIEECLKEELDAKEIYWIAKYNSFNKGYNLTQGGMSKRKLDYDLIIQTYLELNSIHATSNKLGVHRDSVRKALECFDIKYNKKVSAPQSIAMIDIQTQMELKTFPSIKDAAKYVGLSDAAIRKYFAGKSKSAGGYHWKKL